MPFTEQLVRRFTTGDRWFSSLLGPTFPNRQYLYAAQSGGQKNDPGPLKPGMFLTRTIWDNLLDAKVPSAYYYTDLPLLTCGASGSTTSPTRSTSTSRTRSRGSSPRS